MPADTADSIDLLQRLYLRPGFLLRRAHQLSVGLFEDRLKALALTPPQYGVLLIVDHTRGCDQATVARALGFDRVTTLRIVRGLQARGWVASQASVADGRRVHLTLTADGRNALKGARAPAADVSRALLAPLEPAEQALLLSLLRKMCAGLESEARTRLTPPGV